MPRWRGACLLRNWRRRRDWLYSVLAVCTFLAYAVASRAQDYPNTGVQQSTWFAYVGDHAFSTSSPEPRWGLHLEGQLRRSDVVANEQQLLLRPGMFQNVGKQQRLIGGYTYVRNTPPPGSVTILGIEPRHTVSVR